MTDRRDTDPELAPMLSELEETLTELRGRLDEGNTVPVDQSGADRRRRAGRRERPSAPRPPGMRELLRFTEQQTIPTLIAILEANIRLLRLAGAALRAVDPERSAVESGEESAVSRALDAGGRLSTDRLSSGLGDLQEALSGAEATNPEARQLLEEAERLSEEVRERIRESEDRRPGGRQADTGTRERAPSESSGPVHIEVEDATASDDEETAEGTESDSGVDVDAELDSIREEVRGEADEEGSEGSDGGDDHDAEKPGNDESGGDGSTGQNSDGDDSTGGEPGDDESSSDESSSDETTDSN